MLTDLNNTLRQLIEKRVLGEYPNSVDISFDCPRRDWASKIVKPTIDLYFYDLRENVDLRQTTWQVERGQNGRTGTRRPPVFMDLSYFITTWARDIADEHQLLWRVMVALLREPTFMDDVRSGMLVDSVRVVSSRTAQADGVLRNPGEFWSALDNDLKPAVIYSVTLSVDLDVWAEAPLVLTSVIDISSNRRVASPEHGSVAESTDSRPESQKRHITVGGTVRARGEPTGRGAHVPIAGATLIFPNLGISVRSDNDGRFVVPGLPEGPHRVQVKIDDRIVSDQELVVKVEEGQQRERGADMRGKAQSVTSTRPEAASLVARQRYDLEV
jgi:Pvc16 N-terminal domain